MHDAFFYIFAILTVFCAVMVVANPVSRSPITSAMFLVLTITCMAALFVQLHAFFLAAVQILVYAGAVMVLFLFVIMLLDLKEEERRRIKAVSAGLGTLAVGSILFLIIKSTLQFGQAGAIPPHTEGSTASLGKLLFSNYVLPFEILSLLLLVAMVGVILLSKKDLK
ncbi:MAG: NADH:ubiquinone oxidoreductase subunit 6 [Verrucomicrobiales bacterium]|nr:NADH:ubiquinone oxidoreductase subunit 6 [Verrucomicrobiales bacterium]